MDKKEKETYTAIRFYHAGLRAHQLGEIQDAILLYTTAITLNPLHSPVYVCRGAAYKCLGYYELAVQDYSVALKYSNSDKINIHVLSNRANAYTCLNLFAESISDHNSAISKQKNNDPVLYNNRATTYFKMSSLDKARNDYITACGVDPSYAVAFYNLGLVECQLGSIQSSTDCHIYAAQLFAKLAMPGENMHVEDCLKQIRKNTGNKLIRSVATLPPLSPHSSIYQFIASSPTNNPLAYPLPPTSPIYDHIGILKLSHASDLAAAAATANLTQSNGSRPQQQPQQLPPSSNTAQITASNNPYRIDPTNPFNARSSTSSQPPPVSRYTVTSNAPQHNPFGHQLSDATGKPIPNSNNNNNNNNNNNTVIFHNVASRTPPSSSPSSSLQLSSTSSTMHPIVQYGQPNFVSPTELSRVDERSPKTVLNARAPTHNPYFNSTQVHVDTDYQSSVPYTAFNSNVQQSPSSPLSPQYSDRNRILTHHNSSSGTRT